MICRKCPAKLPLMKIDANVKKAIAIRLKHVLEYEQRHYKHWEEHIKPKLKSTRSKQVERVLRQRIQAIKIVIWMLTPNLERNDDFPGFWKN